MAEALIIRGGKLLDAASRTAPLADILVIDGTIAAIGSPGLAAPAEAATFDASKAFKAIAASSGDTLKSSQEILAATEVQKLSIGDVVRNVEEVVAIAEQTASGTRQVSATAQQLSNSMQELTTSSQHLTAIANDLQAGLATFRLTSQQRPGAAGRGRLARRNGNGSNSNGTTLPNGRANNGSSAADTDDLSHEPED